MTFDPRRISYGRILQIFFSVAHDPTELNFRGRTTVRSTARRYSRPMRGRRSVADAYIAQLDKAHVFPVPDRHDASKPAARSIRPRPITRTTWPSIRTTPISPTYDLPKLRELQSLFPDLYRANPVLVASAAKPVP